MSTDSRKNPFRTGRTLVIAHNGGDGEYPADTLAAYEHSMAVGGQVLDIDVGLSADHVLVAFHDETTFAVTGTPGTVAGMTLRQLRKLDAGWGFESPNGTHPFRGKQLHISTVAELFARYPNMLTSLDLKDYRHDVISPLCDLLSSSHRLELTFVGTKSITQNAKLRKQCPGVHTAATLTEDHQLQAARRIERPSVCLPDMVDQPNYRDNGHVNVTAKMVAYAHAHNIAVMPWVIDDTPTLTRLVDMGVDAIYTRKPHRLAEIVDAKTRRQRPPGT